MPLIVFTLVAALGLWGMWKITANMEDGKEE